MFSSVIRVCSALLAFSRLAHALPSARDEPEEGPPTGYGIVSIDWDIPIDPATPGGTTAHLSGTIQEVVDKMEHDYPGWNETFHQHMRWSPTSDALALDIGNENYDVDHLECEEKWKYMANRQRIWEGIDYLMNLPANTKPKNGPGPGNCGRVSCSHRGAIFWCNDNKQEKELNSWDDLGIAAFKVYKECQFTPYDLCGGRVFYKDKWNVIVKKDVC